MVKKYIVELESGTHIFVLGPEGIVHIGEPDVVYETVDGMQIGNAVINAKPYTEPDLEQVREEAYQKGYETGYEDGYNEPGKNQQEAYQRGLADAWEAAKKIALGKEDGGLDTVAYCEIFGYGKGFGTILKKFSASEAIEKIRQYEQEEIKVGDEVGYYGVADEHGNVCYSGVVLEIREDDYFVMEKTGKTYALKKNLAQGKTGRHFPEIATILEKMRGEQDG